MVHLTHPVQSYALIQSLRTTFVSAILIQSVACTVLPNRPQLDHCTNSMAPILTTSSSLLLSGPRSPGLFGLTSFPAFFGSEAPEHSSLADTLAILRSSVDWLLTRICTHGDAPTVCTMRQAPRVTAPRFAPLYQSNDLPDDDRETFKCAEAALRVVIIYYLVSVKPSIQVPIHKSEESLLNVPP
ncbi:hypothetical protein AHF37_08331 [Paragonimus kellicotti]|nr:hypothetical protein AHF37_08331 [Paragonimus kellicotti]